MTTVMSCVHDGIDDAIIAYDAALDDDINDGIDELDDGIDDNKIMLIAW